MEATQFHRIAKALADRRRFEVFEIIARAGDEVCCGAIKDCFTVSQATSSHHLKELADAGLVGPRAAGQFKLFRARLPILQPQRKKAATKRRATEGAQPGLNMRVTILSTHDLDDCRYI